MATRCVRIGQVLLADTSEPPGQDYLQLEVSDTGCGISSETRERMFDPFFTTKSAGRGLGLAVVSGIVRRVGGQIYVASELGKGTTFQVMLPCAENETEPICESIAGDEEMEAPSQECTVLVVEDELPLRQAVVKRLRHTGFQVLEAPDGCAAIDLLRDIPKIDVLLLDLSIPGTSSAQVLAEAAHARSDIRVILTSAYSREMVTTPLNGSHVRGFIRKPFQLGDLVRTVRRAFAVA